MDINFEDLTINKEGGKVTVSANFKNPKPNSSESNLALKYANADDIKKLLKQNNVQVEDCLKNGTLDTRYPKTMSAEWVFSAPQPSVKKPKKTSTSKAEKKDFSSKPYSAKKKTTKKEV